MSAGIDPNKRRAIDKAAVDTARYVLAHPDLYADQPAYAATLRRLAEMTLKREESGK